MESGLEAPMSCGGGQTSFVATGVTDGSTSETFVPVSAPMSLRGFEALRGRFEALTDNTNLSVRLGYRYSDDGRYWTSAASGVGTPITGAGWFYGAWFTPPTSSAGFIQLGVMVKNAAGTSFEAGTFHLLVEQRS